MCVGSILESHEEDHVKKDFNATLGSPRFNEICDMLHENNVMFRDTDILHDNTARMLIMESNMFMAGSYFNVRCFVIIKRGRLCKAERE